MVLSTRKETSQPQNPATAGASSDVRSNDGLHNQLKEADFDAGSTLLSPDASAPQTEAPSTASTAPASTTSTPAPAPTGAPQTSTPAPAGVAPLAPTTQASTPPAARPGAVTAADRQALLKEKAQDISTIEELLSYSTFDWNVTEKEASRALGLINRAAQPGRIVMVQELNRRSAKFLDRLLANVKGDTSRAHFGAYLTLLVLNNRQGEVTKIIRQSPAAAGASAAEGEAIAWALDLLPDATWTAIGRDEAAFSPATQWAALAPAPTGPQLNQELAAARVEGAEVRVAKEERQAEEAKLDAASREAMANNKDFAAKVHSVQDLLSYKAFDWVITDKEASRAFRILGGLGSSDEVQMAVFELDRGPFMDRFVGEIPRGERDADKRTFLRILSARQPEKNVRFAQDLLSYGVFDWRISDEEGRLAFAIVKSMPRDIRDEFRSRDGGKWWDRMEGNLSTEDAGHRDTNLYENTGESNQLKLSFREDCAKLNPTLLRQQVEMLLRMGEVDFVEATLMQAGLDQSDAHAWLYAKYGFAGAGHARDAKTFDSWMQNVVAPPADVSWWAGLKNLFKNAGLALSALGHLALGTKGEASGHLDLAAIAALLGGNVGGITFAEGKEEGDNTLDVKMALASGRVQVASPRLAIASIQRLSGGVQLETGPVTVSGVHFDVKWPTKDDPSSHLIVRIDGIDAREIWQVSEDAMVTVDHLALGALDLRAERAQGEVPTDTKAALATLLAELSDTLTNMIGALRIKGPDATPVNTEFGKSALGGMPATLSLGSLAVEGYASSDGAHVASANVTQLKAELAFESRTAKITQEIATLESDPEQTPEKTARIAALRTEHARLLPLEARFNELQAKAAQPEGKLEPWEQEELKQLRDSLTAMSSKVEAKTFGMKDAHMGGQTLASVEATDLKAEMSATRAADDEGALGSGYSVTAQATMGTMTIEGMVAQGKNRLDASKARLAELKQAISGGTASDADAAQYESLFKEVRGIEQQIARRDVLLLNDARKPAEETELASLTAALEPWVTRSASTSIDKAALRQVSVQGDADAGTVALQAGEASLQGIQTDGVEIASLDAKNASVSAVMAGGGPSPLGALGTAQVKADALTVKGVATTGKRPSEALRKRYGDFSERERLYPEGHPRHLSALERKEFEALPAKIDQALADEVRITELRALREQDPNALSAGQVAELRYLEERNSASFAEIAALEVHDAELHLDAGKGSIGAKLGGEHGKGLSVTGVRTGHVHDGEKVAELELGQASAQTLNATMNTKDGKPLDLLAVQQGQQAVEASVGGTGIEVDDVKRRTAGNPGYTTVDHAHIGSLAASLDTEGAGEITAKVQDVGVQGFQKQGGDALEVAWQDVAKLEHLLATGANLSEKQAARLEAARKFIADADQLKQKIAKAKTKAERSKYEQDLQTQLKLSDLRVDDLQLTDAEVGVTGAGNVLAPDFNVAAADIGVHAKVGGELNASGVQVGNTQVGALAVRDATVDVEHANDAKTRTVAAHVGSAEVNDVKAGTTSVKSASASNVNVAMLGDDLSARADELKARQIKTKGVSVSQASVTGVNAQVTDLGKKNQVVKGGVATVSANGVHVSNRSKDGSTTTAHVGSLKGRRGAVVLGPGGTVSGSLANFSAADVAVTAKDKSGATTVQANVDALGGNGVRMGMAGGKTSASVDGLSADGVKASGSALGGREVSVKHVTVDGTQAQVGKDGGFSAQVNSVGVQGISATDSKGNSAKVDHVDLQGISASGNTKDKTISHAGVASLEVAGVDVKQDGQDVTLRLATVKGLSASNVDYSDPKAMTGTFGLGTASLEGVDYKKGTPGQAGAMHVKADRIGIGDEKAVSEVILNADGTLDGSLRSISVSPDAAATWTQADKTTGALSTHEVKLQADKSKGGVNIGEIKAENFNPADLTQDGSTLQVKDIDAHSFVYDQGTQHLVGKGAHIDALVMQGQGKGQVLGGYSGLDVASVEGQGEVKGAKIHDASLKGIHSDGGYAVAQGLKPGETPKLSYAQLQSLSVDQIQADVKLPAAQTGDAAYEAAMKKYQANKGKSTTYDLSGLQNVDGRVGGSYTYNKDDGTFMDAAGAFFTGRTAEVGVNIKDGTADLKNAEIQGKEASLLGGPVLWGTEKVVHGAGHVMDWTKGKPGPSIPGELTVPGATTAPKREDFTPGAIADKHAWMDRTEADIELTDLGGGRLGAGNTSAMMNRGGHVSAKGKVGDQLTVQGGDIGFTDGVAMDGQLKVAKAGVDNVQVGVHNLKDPNNTRVTANVEGTKVGSVRYGGAGVDVDKADKSFEALTQQESKK